MVRTRVRTVATCSRCVAVRPSVRPSPATAVALRWDLRGSARCTGSSGLGDTAASIPAGGGPVREAKSASRAARRPHGAQGLYGECASRVDRTGFGRKSTASHDGDQCSHHGSWRRVRRSGGAYRGRIQVVAVGSPPGGGTVTASARMGVSPSRAGAPERCVRPRPSASRARGRCAAGRTQRCASRRTGPSARFLRGSMVPGSYGATRLSTARGGGDAVVGGVEQYRR